MSMGIDQCSPCQWHWTPSWPVGLNPPCLACWGSCTYTTPAVRVRMTRALKSTDILKFKTQIKQSICQYMLYICTKNMHGYHLVVCNTNMQYTN